MRRFHVVAEPCRLVYRDPELVDPFGLIYRLVSITDPNGVDQPVTNPVVPEPLVLRCCQEEWVEVTVENHLPGLIRPEPFAPSVPVEARDPRTFRPLRPVSSRVSMHADMLLYDVTEDDGANPAPPVWHVPASKTVRLHLVGACDKPRNHSFTVHAVTWPEYRFLSPGSPRVASESAITSGTVRTFEFMPEHPGDHAYRSGVLKWAVSQGLWGIVRVV